MKKKRRNASKREVKLELAKVFLRDAADLIGAREKAIILHHTQDIDTAGDEVEQMARTILKRKLPLAYYVGHGHVVDSELACSGQFDVIIADNANTPVLFRAEDGTEYIPYENVYAVGEIKSSYAKDKAYIEHFTKKLKLLKGKLKRANTKGIIRECGNPLFAFMLFVKGGDFRSSDISAHYHKNQPDYLPSIVCMLDKGIIGSARFTKDNEYLGIDKHPDPLDPLSEAEGLRRDWVFSKSDGHELMCAYILAQFYYYLITHVMTCKLTVPIMAQYVRQMFQGDMPGSQVDLL